MKKQMFYLILNTVIFTTCPLFAMDVEKDDLFSDIGKNYTVSVAQIQSFKEKEKSSSFDVSEWHFSIDERKFCLKISSNVSNYTKKDEIFTYSFFDGLEWLNPRDFFRVTGQPATGSFVATICACINRKSRELLLGEIVDLNSASYRSVLHEDCDAEPYLREILTTECRITITERK